MLKSMLAQLASVFRSLPIPRRRSQPKEALWTRDSQLAHEMEDRAQFVADRFPFHDRTSAGNAKAHKKARRTRDLTRAMHQHQRRVGSA